jgi:hypothetical protein
MAKAKVADRIALIEITPNGDRARFTFPATEEGAAKAEARLAHFVSQSTNDFRLDVLVGQPA